MARAFWKGSIRFGLVNIPVGLFSAESSEELTFHQQGAAARRSHAG